MRRKPNGKGGEDNSHYSKAFTAAAKRDDTRDKLSRATSSGARNLHSKVLRQEDAKLEGLTDKDRMTTLVLEAYRRRNNPQLDAESEMKKWLRGESDELGTYTELINWCSDKRVQLDGLEQQRQLTVGEARLISGLDEIDRLDERTIRHRFRNQYGAHGHRGHPKR
jgi:hypothetical protein